MHMDDPADGAWAPGVGGARDEVHLQMCTNKFCTRCFWILNGATLKKKVGDWLDFKLDFASRHAAVGCSWCALAKDDPAMVRLGLFKTNNLGFASYQNGAFATESTLPATPPQACSMPWAYRV